MFFMFFNLLALGFPPTPPISLTPAESGAASLVTALFGSERSSQAFARQSLSTRDMEVELGIQPGDSRAVSLTYGEFDLSFFFELLRRASPQRGERFTDVGSGCGRLVLAAALTHEWELASGVELLPALNSLAVDAHARLSELLVDEPTDEIALAPCTFVCGEADERLPELLGTTSGGQSSHVVFVYATAWPSTGPVLGELSRTLGTSLPVGSRVITIDKQLCSDDSEAVRWAFEPLGSPIEAPNYNTFTSVAYVYERVASDGGRPGGRGDRGENVL